MPTTRLQTLEMLQRLLLGGMASDDTELTINLINQHLNGAIAYAAKANYKEEIELNGVEDVADAFYADFNSLVITKDNTTGLYNTILPQQPAGLGAGWDISTFMLITGSGSKLFAHPISAREVEFLYKTSGACSEVYYWVTGIEVSLHACKDITPYKANIRMISSQSSDFSAPITLPDGYLPLVVEYMSKVLGIQMQRPIDISSDGVETTQVK